MMISDETETWKIISRGPKDIKCEWCDWKGWSDDLPSKYLTKANICCPKCAEQLPKKGFFYLPEYRQRGESIDYRHYARFAFLPTFTQDGWVWFRWYFITETLYGWGFRDRFKYKTPKMLKYIMIF